MKYIYLINGPNLNLLGHRNQAVYGTDTLEEIVQRLKGIAANLGYSIVDFQSNHEGQLIDWIQSAPGKTDGIILNAGGLTHTSVSLRDAVDFAREQGVPTVEVHLSDIHKRETFRHVSLLTGVCVCQISGFGAESYTKGLAEAIKHLAEVTKK